VYCTEEHGEDDVSAADAGVVGRVHPFIAGCQMLPVFNVHYINFTHQEKNLFRRSLLQSQI